MRPRTRAWLMIGVAVVVVAGAIVFAAGVWVKEDGNIPWVLSVPLIAVLLLVVVLWREVRLGLVDDLPLEDERSLAIKHRAGYYAFMFSLYWWLALHYFDNYLSADENFTLGMIGMALSFGLAWLFLTLREGRG